MSCTLTRLGYGLMNALIECQISYDTNNVPLNLQGISAKLINSLEELQAPVGNYSVTVALDLQMCFSKFRTFIHLTKQLKSTTVSTGVSLEIMT